MDEQYKQIKVIRDDVDLYGKRVMVRVDFNITFKNRAYPDYYNDDRLRKTIPLINFLIKKGAKIIIGCHYGRPEGIYKEEFSVKPIVDYFSRLMGLKWKPITQRGEIKNLLLIEDKEIDEFHNLIFPLYLLKPHFNINSSKDSFDNGDILFLENLRFDKREEGNSEELAQFYNKLCDIYINEAFSTSHRSHASITAIKRLAKEFYFGFLYKSEVDNLIKFVEQPLRPLILVIGGAKSETKLKLVKKFLTLADHILIGGVIANIILSSKGITIGSSLIDDNLIESAKDLMQDFDLTSTRIHLPLDVVCAPRLESATPEESMIFPIGNIPVNYMIGDLGPDTVRLFANIISKAKSVVWNGTLGYTESHAFREASAKIAKAIVRDKERYSLVGGGDTVSFLREINMADKFTFISTGGGAMLEFLIDPPKFFY